MFTISEVGWPGTTQQSLTSTSDWWCRCLFNDQSLDGLPDHARRIIRIVFLRKNKNMQTLFTKQVAFKETSSLQSTIAHMWFSCTGLWEIQGKETIWKSPFNTSHMHQSTAKFWPCGRSGDTPVRPAAPKLPVAFEVHGDARRRAVNCWWCLAP